MTTKNSVAGRYVIEFMPDISAQELKDAEKKFIAPYQKIEDTQKRIIKNNKSMFTGVRTGFARVSAGADKIKSAVDKIRGGLIVGGIGTVLSLVDAGFREADGSLDAVLQRGKLAKNVSQLTGATSAQSQKFLALATLNGGDASDLLDASAQFQDNLARNPALASQFSNPNQVNNFLDFIDSVRRQYTNADGTLQREQITSILSPILGEDGLKKMLGVVFSDKSIEEQLQRVQELYADAGITDAALNSAVDKTASLEKDKREKEAIQSTLDLINKAETINSDTIDQSIQQQQQQLDRELELLGKYESLADVFTAQQKTIQTLQDGLFKAQEYLIASIEKLMEQVGAGATEEEKNRTRTNRLLDMDYGGM